jgi:hypothetical protein
MGDEDAASVVEEDKAGDREEEEAPPAWLLAWMERPLFGPRP